MTYKVLTEGFESSVRTRLGVKEGEVTNEMINTRLIAELGETTILKRVPDYQSITDDTELLYLESAVVSYICYLICPSLARLLNSQVTTLDVSWKKDRIDWSTQAETFLAEADLTLMQIQSVIVDFGSGSNLVQISRNARLPLQ